MLNKFCNKESKELRISCAVLSVLFVVLAVVTEPAALVGSTVVVVLAAGAGVTVVATGGLAQLISSDTDCIDHVEPMLTLEGLRLIYERNK